MRTYLYLRIGLISLIVALCAPWVRAEEVSTQALPTVNLNDLMETAIQNNPSLIAAKAESEASRTRIWSESAFSDPMVEIAPGDMESEYMISQAIPFPWKLLEKAKIAKNESQVAELNYEIIKRDLSLKLSDAYFDLYYTDASLETIREVKDLLKRFESIASTRYSNLSGTQRDAAKAQAEVSMALERLYQLEQKRESAAAVINALLNRDPMLPVGRAELPSKPILEYTLVELINIAVESRQEIQAAEAMVVKAAHTKRLSKLSYIPDVDIGVRYTNSKEEEDFWMLPIQFNVPVWVNRNIPQIQEAKYLEEARKAELLNVKNMTFQEVKDSYYKFQSAMKMTELYETAVIPQAKLALSADQAGYEAGSVDFLNLLDSERVYFNAKLSYIQFYTEALKAYVDLLRCCGLTVLSPKKEGVKTNEQK